jgi:hypothetical protein
MRNQKVNKLQELLFSSSLLHRDSKLISLLEYFQMNEFSNDALKTTELHGRDCLVAPDGKVFITFLGHQFRVIPIPENGKYILPGIHMESPNGDSKIVIDTNALIEMSETDIFITEPQSTVVKQFDFNQPRPTV